MTLVHMAQRMLPWFLIAVGVITLECALGFLVWPSVPWLVVWMMAVCVVLPVNRLLRRLGWLPE